jgi:hypothetical protein
MALNLAILLRLAAAAATPTPTAPPPPAAPSPPAVPTTIPDLHAGAACLIGRDPQAADPLLGAAPYSAAEHQLAARALLDMQRCLRRAAPMTTSVARVRGVLAEAVVERRVPSPVPARSPPLAVRPLLGVELIAPGTDATGLVPAYAMAECTVARRPDLVRALLATVPATDDASAAFAALRPTFAACLAGARGLSIDPPTLRGVLAEDLYRWSLVQRDGPGSPLAAPPASSGRQ